MASKSPTPFHNFWGVVTDSTELPNVAGATIQDAAVEAGDFAVTTGGFGFVCVTPTVGAAVWETSASAADGETANFSNSLNTGDNISISRTFAGGGDAIGVSMGAATTGHGFNCVIAAGAAGDGVHVEDSGSGPAIFANKIGAAGSAMQIQDSGADVFAISAAGAVASSPTAGANATVTVSEGGNLLQRVSSAAAVSPGIDVESNLSGTASGGSIDIGSTVTDTAAGGAIGITTSAAMATTGGDITMEADSVAAGATSGDVIIATISSGGGTPGGTVIAAGGVSAPAASAGAVTVRASTTVNVTVTSVGTGIFIGDATGCARMFHEEVAGSGGDSCVQLNATGGTAAGSFAIGTVGGYANFTPTDGSVEGALGGIDTALGAGGGDSLQTAYATGNTIAVTAANGTVSISNSADATDALTVARTFAGAGDAISVSMGASTTGRGINVTTGNAANIAYRASIGSSAIGLDIVAGAVAPTAGVRVTVGGGTGILTNSTGASGSSLLAQRSGATMLDVSPTGAILLQGRNGGAITLDNATAGGGLVFSGSTIDFNGTGAFTVDTTAGGISLDGLGNSNFTVSTNTVGAGGTLTLQAGDSSSAGSAGGTCTIRGGAGSTGAGDGGNLDMRAGSGSAGTDGGDVVIEGGPGGTGQGGSVDINAGTASGNDGLINIGTARGQELNLGRATGITIGFFGVTPVAQSAAYTRNATIVEDRTLLASASATTLNNNNVLAALIADLQAIGILG